MNVICSFIHRYASARIEKLRAEGKITHRSRLNKWIPVTVRELEGFLAIIINMGIINAPAIEDYWKTSWVAEIPFFHRVMPRDRFELFWMLHVSHSTASPPKRIDKVGMLLDRLIRKFQDSYAPSRNLAVDETMLRFRGRFVGKQYMPKKPVKWGIKSFTLADSSNGYVLNTLLYTGTETMDVANQEHSTLPQPARVVMHLMEPYLHKHHHLFTDRYYTSVPLAKALQQNGTAFTGTVNRDRVDIPDPIRAGTTPQEGEVLSFRNDRMMALTWRAKKKKAPVIVLSTECSAQMVAVHSHGPGQSQKLKPSAVDTYNHNMNGVDIADQYTVSYPFQRKTLKWWRKVFFWLVDVCIVNSYALYRAAVTKPMTHITYRRQIVETLATRHISSAPPRPRVGRPQKRSHPESRDPERLNGKLHLLGKRQQRCCVVCNSYGTGERHRTIFFCKTCHDHPSLCPGTCFEQYHTLANY